VFTEDEWRALCHVIGDPPWTKEKRFAALSDRLACQDELDRHVETWTQQHAPEEVMMLLQQAGVPAGVVANGEDLDRDPQLRARGYWAQVKTLEGDEVVLDGTPIKLSATQGYIAAPGPLLGEHTESVLKRLLGYSQEQITQLKAERVVASDAEIRAER
jgi:crotonobetainyl-CoA:carnitine CoA-transferase CaiB-like acyl-CoA transferase